MLCPATYQSGAAQHRAVGWPPGSDHRTGRDALDSEIDGGILGALPHCECPTDAIGDARDSGGRGRRADELREQRRRQSEEARTVTEELDSLRRQRASGSPDATSPAPSPPTAIKKESVTRSVPPLRTARRPSTWAGSQLDRLSRVRLWTLPSSRQLSRRRMAGGEERLGVPLHRAREREASAHGAAVGGAAGNGDGQARLGARAGGGAGRG